MIDPSAMSWLKYEQETKAAHKEHITLIADEYVGGSAPRVARVMIMYGGGGDMQTITVTQLHTVVIEGGRADFENFATEGYGVITPIEDETTEGWKLKNGNICKYSMAGYPEHKFPLLVGLTETTGTLTSPILKGGCGTLTVAMAGEKLKNFVPKGIKVKVEIIQNKIVKKSTFLEITQDEYEQNQIFNREYEVNVSGEYEIVITNACPSQIPSGTGSRAEDVMIPSVSWTGYSE